MTAQEIQALAQLLARIPMTQAETLWVRTLLSRLTSERDDPADRLHEQPTNGREEAIPV